MTPTLIIAHFVADFIDTGNLNASLITAGVLKDSNSNFVLDLATGQMAMKKGSISLGNGNFSLTDAGLMIMKRGSINLGNGNFEVTDSGSLTASNANLSDATLTGSLTTGARTDGIMAYLAGGVLSFIKNNSTLAQLFFQSTGRTDLQGLQISCKQGNITLVLRNDGEIVVGKSSSPYYYVYFLIRSSHIKIIDDLGSMGYSYDGVMITTDEGSTYYIDAATSDVKLKKNIEDSAVDALSMINAIEHKRFDFIKYEKHRECGYVAQQLETVNEEFVMDVEQGDGSTIKQVNTFELLSYATKAIQELSAKVDTLEERIATLEKEL